MDHISKLLENFTKRRPSASSVDNKKSIYKSSIRPQSTISNCSKGGSNYFQTYFENLKPKKSYIIQNVSNCNITSCSNNSFSLGRSRSKSPVYPFTRHNSVKNAYEISFQTTNCDSGDLKREEIQEGKEMIQIINEKKQLELIEKQLRLKIKKMREQVLLIEGKVQRTCEKKDQLIKGKLRTLREVKDWENRRVQKKEQQVLKLEKNKEEKYKNKENLIKNQVERVKTNKIKAEEIKKIKNQTHDKKLQKIDFEYMQNIEKVRQIICYEKEQKMKKILKDSEKRIITKQKVSLNLEKEKEKVLSLKKVICDLEKEEQDLSKNLYFKHCEHINAFDNLEKTFYSTTGYNTNRGTGDTIFKNPFLSSNCHDSNHETSVFINTSILSLN